MGCGVVVIIIIISISIIMMVVDIVVGLMVRVDVGFRVIGGRSRALRVMVRLISRWLSKRNGMLTLLQSLSNINISISRGRSGC